MAFSPRWISRHYRRGPYSEHDYVLLEDLDSAIQQVQKLTAADNFLLTAKHAMVEIIMTIVTPCANTDPRTQSLRDKVQLKASLLNLARQAIPFPTLACMLHESIETTDFMTLWSHRNMTTVEAACIGGPQDHC